MFSNRGTPDGMFPILVKLDFMHPSGEEPIDRVFDKEGEKVGR